MLEELFWESNSSGYNFYDYMTISKDINSNQQVGAKDFGLDKPFYSSTLGAEMDLRPLSVSTVKDLSLVGDYYSNSIQLEDSALRPLSTSANLMSLMPITNEAVDLDDSFLNYKSYASLFSKFSAISLGSSNFGLNARSYISVFNHFRSDYEDFA